VGTALVRASEERLAALGSMKIAAIVVDGHEHAEAFWLAVGYEPESQRRFTKHL
jgi:hypothetical protein